MEKYGKPISPEEARKMCNAYQEKHPEGTRSINFSNDSLQRLAKEGQGLTVHLAMNEDGKVTVVLEGGSALEEFGGVCPPVCPPKLSF